MADDDFFPPDPIDPWPHTPEPTPQARRSGSWVNTFFLARTLNQIERVQSQAPPPAPLPPPRRKRVLDQDPLESAPLPTVCLPKGTQAIKQRALEQAYTEFSNAQGQTRQALGHKIAEVVVRDPDYQALLPIVDTACHLKPMVKHAQWLLERAERLAQKQAER